MHLEENSPESNLYDRLNDNESQRHSTLSSQIDWNDEKQIERNVKRQLEAPEKTKAVPRVSQYFGALHVDRIDETEMPDDRIKGIIKFILIKILELFEEGLGKKIRLKPKKILSNKIEGPSHDRTAAPMSSVKLLNQDIPLSPPKPQSIPSQSIYTTSNLSHHQVPSHSILHNQSQHAHPNPFSHNTIPNNTSNLSHNQTNQPQPFNQTIQMSNNTFNNDQSCQIILNFYNVKCPTPGLSPGAFDECVPIKKKAAGIGPHLNQSTPPLKEFKLMGSAQ